MAYSYYQTQVPGWGTSQFQYPAPPQPTFQPQPSWRGYDFYNAHAMNPDPGLFESIMGRLRDLLGMGIGHSDARHWHRKVYSGLVPLGQLLPADIGAAAAYEAYRTWKHNPFLHEPLSADRERQREGLIGMAIAETQRLWAYSGRTLDTYGLRNASEAAAVAASALADRLANYSAFGRASSYASSGDTYGYEDSYHRHGSRSRRNSFTAPSVVRVGGSPLLGSPALPYGTPVTSPMPVPGTAMSAGVPGSYGSAYGSPYGGAAQTGLPGSYTYSSGMTPGNVSPNPYGAAAAAASPYTFNGVPVGAYGNNAAGYPSAAAGYTTLPNGQIVPAGSTVIITHPHRSRRHSHSGHHHHHSSSASDRYDDYEREREKEREERDWERADRERHERDRLRWEREERERYGAGVDDYGRYGRTGSSSYGYGGRY